MHGTPNANRVHAHGGILATGRTICTRFRPNNRGVDKQTIRIKTKKSECLKHADFLFKNYYLSSS